MLGTSPLISFVATSNARKAKEFYKEIVCLTFVSEDPFALVFESNGNMLRIQIVDKVSPHDYTAIGWQVTDIHEEVRQLEKRGVVFAHYPGIGQDIDGIWKAPSGAKVAWFTDPEGNILSLTQFPEGK
jgi:predicted enzyme related to lactoylglutathione lyase